VRGILWSLTLSVPLCYAGIKLYDHEAPWHVTALEHLEVVGAVILWAGLIGFAFPRFMRYFAEDRINIDEGMLEEVFDGHEAPRRATRHLPR